MQVDLGMMYPTNLSTFPFHMGAAFGPVQALHVSSEGVRLAPVSSAGLDAVWIEGGGLDRPRVAYWKTGEEQALTLEDGELQGQSIHFEPVSPTIVAISSSALTSPCPALSSPDRFGWSDGIVLGDQVHVESVGPEQASHCRELELESAQTSTPVELCLGGGSFPFQQGDTLRIERKDLLIAGSQHGAHILRLDRTRSGSPNETIWLVRGYHVELAAALASPRISRLSWDLASLCELTPEDGCGIGGIPAQLRVTVTSEQRTFTLRVGESVRGNFGANSPTEFRVVRAAYRPFRSIDCRHDAIDFGMVLIEPFTDRQGDKPAATMAR